jgi:hypothetical protein
MPKTTLAGIFTRIKRKYLNYVFLLQVFFALAIFVFRETRFFCNIGSFAKSRNSQNSSLIFAKHENRFVASFAKFSRNEISSKTLRVRHFAIQGFHPCATVFFSACKTSIILKSKEKLSAFRRHFLYSTVQYV